jgi:hypothetical protein
MILLKKKISKLIVLLLFAVVAVSFHYKPFALDGGTILNPNIVVTGSTVPTFITATAASGCAGTITYQWQQSFDNVNYADILNAADTSYQPKQIITTTHFRRKATCAGGEYAYTNNVAVVIVATQ